MAKQIEGKDMVDMMNLTLHQLTVMFNEATGKKVNRLKCSKMEAVKKVLAAQGKIEKPASKKAAAPKKTRTRSLRTVKPKASPKKAVKAPATCCDKVTSASSAPVPVSVKLTSTDTLISASVPSVS